MAALGGPSAVLGLSFSRQVVVTSAISAALGLGLVLWMLWRPLKAGTGVHAGIGVGASTLIALSLRQAMSSEPILAPIAWGFIGGFMTSAAVLPPRLERGPGG